MKFVKVFLAAVTLITASVSPAFADAKVEILGASYGGIVSDRSIKEITGKVRFSTEYTTAQSTRS